MPSKMIHVNENTIRRPQEGANIVDRVGQRYGNLTVSHRSGSRGTQATWFCQCDCGKTKIVGANHLRDGATKSCGCIRKSGKGSRAFYKSQTAPGASAQRTVLKLYRWQAKRRGFIWDLTEDQFIAVTQKNCHYCGVPPYAECKPSRNGSYVYNGIDRVDNAEGYTINNIVSCCKICNHAKHVMPIEIFTAWLDRLVMYRSRLGALMEPVRDDSKRRRVTDATITHIKREIPW